MLKRKSAGADLLNSIVIEEPLDWAGLRSTSVALRRSSPSKLSVELSVRLSATPTCHTEPTLIHQNADFLIIVPLTGFWEMGAESTPSMGRFRQLKSDSLTLAASG